MECQRPDVAGRLPPGPQNHTLDWQTPRALPGDGRSSLTLVILVAEDTGTRGAGLEGKRIVVPVVPQFHHLEFWHASHREADGVEESVDGF